MPGTVNSQGRKLGVAPALPMINGVTRGHRQHTLPKPKELEIALCTTNPVAKPTGNGGLPVPWLPGTAQRSVASNSHPGAALEPSLPCKGDTWEGQKEEKNTELCLTGSMCLLPGLYFEMKSKCGENMSDIPGSKTS